MRRFFKRCMAKGIGAGEGIVDAVFATLNVIDRDEDVTLPGAFGSQEALISPAHNWMSVPLGKAAIEEEDDQAIAHMNFNLESSLGRDWFSAIKMDVEQGTPLIEWSYGYEILEAEQGEWEGETVQFLKKLKVIEVSPVMVGAGINTRTLAAKHGLRPRFHVKQKGGLSHRELESQLRKALAGRFGGEQLSIWIEDIFDESVVFSQVKWTTGEETLFQLGYSVEDQVVSIADDPTEVRRQIRFIETENGKSLKKEFESVEAALVEVSTYYARVKSLAALRAKEGRTLSAQNRDRLRRLFDLVSEVQGDIDKLLQEAEPDPDKAAALFLSFRHKRREIDQLLRRRTNYLIEN